jgi:hypothetical protein
MTVEGSDLANVKIIFELDPEDWHGCPAESLWAELASGSDGSRFCLLNSPFYATGVSFLDVVEATPIDGSTRGYTFRDVVERSGHSTFMILAKPDEPRLNAYWKLLEQAGCSYESGTIDLGIGRRRLLSVDVPPAADLDTVCELLERGHHDKVWIFQEGHRQGRAS